MNSRPSIIIIVFTLSFFFKEMSIKFVCQVSDKERGKQMDISCYVFSSSIIAFIICAILLVIFASWGIYHNFRKKQFKIEIKKTTNHVMLSIIMGEFCKHLTLISPVIFV